MTRDLYHFRYHEALAKAFAARTENVRQAYIDLADFYRRKFEGAINPVPSNEVLRRCLEARRQAK